MSDKRTVPIDDVTNLLCDHLRDCDLDELIDIAEYISGAKLSLPENPEQVEELWVFEVGEDYCGMFDKILCDENGKTIV